MFTHHCKACDKTQLIFFSQVTGLAATDHGTAVTFTCWCGSEQTWDAAVRATDVRVAA
jgi:hypothetical protein